MNRSDARSASLSLIRWLSLAALVLGAGQIAFGAIVRVTGSGLGCGDHWPQCDGHWFPPLNRLDLIIEVTHRYIAATLTTCVVALVLLTWFTRREPGVAGRGGVMRPALLSGALVIAAALLGAVTVWLQLANPVVIASHLALAMSLLAVLIVALVRAGGAAVAPATVGGPPRERKYGDDAANASSIERTSHPLSAASTASPATARAAAIAAAFGFVAIVLGALTANVAGANTACAGIPLCRGWLLPNEPLQYLQFVHRIIAYGLFVYIGILGVQLAKRGERRMAVIARIVLTLLFAQVIVALTMVVLHLPAVWRSLHAAFGTLLWVALFYFAYVARRAAFGAVRPDERAPVMSPVAEAGA